MLIFVFSLLRNFLNVCSRAGQMNRTDNTYRTRGNNINLVIYIYIYIYIYINVFSILYIGLSHSFFAAIGPQAVQSKPEWELKGVCAYFSLRRAAGHFPKHLLATIKRTPPYTQNRCSYSFSFGYVNLLDAMETYWMPWILPKGVTFQDSDPPEAAGHRSTWLQASSKQLTYLKHVKLAKCRFSAKHKTKP